MPLHVKLLTDADIGEFKTRAADALNPTRADGDHVTPDLAPLAILLNSSIAAGAFPGPLIDTYLAEPVDTGAVLGVEVARPPSELREDDAVIAAEVKAKILTNGGASLKSHLQRLGLATEGFDAFVLEKEITIFGPPEPPMPPMPPPAPVSPPSPPRKDSAGISTGMIGPLIGTLAAAAFLFVLSKLAGGKKNRVGDEKKARKRR